jgi:hypothetical protein
VARVIGVKGARRYPEKWVLGVEIFKLPEWGDVLENLANKLPHGRAWDILTEAMQEEDGKILVDLFATG